MSTCNCTGQCRKWPYTCSGAITATNSKIIQSMGMLGIGNDMSGCKPTETLSMCAHGVPVKFGCKDCGLADLLQILVDHKNRQIDENRKISRRVDEIQKWGDSHLSCWNSLDEKINDVSNKVDNLETQDKNGYMYLKGQIEALSERIEKLEKYISLIESLNKNRNDWMKPISELEDFNKRQITWNNDTCNWLSKIENMVDNKSGKVDKKPHKCPVCDGICYSSQYREDNIKRVGICKSCDGKGIVWG